MPSVCGCRGLTSHFYRYFHHNKLHGDGSVAIVDREGTFTDTSTFIRSMEIALHLQSVTVVD